jgi:hypothetical protein
VMVVVIVCSSSCAEENNNTDLYTHTTLSRSAPLQVHNKTDVLCVLRLPIYLLSYVLDFVHAPPAQTDQ